MSAGAAADSPVMTVRVAARLAENRGESMVSLPTTGLRAIADAFKDAVEALEELVRLKDDDSGWGSTLTVRESAWDAARAALAKARGEADA